MLPDGLIMQCLCDMLMCISWIVRIVEHYQPEDNNSQSKNKQL